MKNMMACLYLNQLKKYLLVSENQIIQFLEVIESEGGQISNTQQNNLIHLTFYLTWEVLNCIKYYF